jgi:Xaa-Pro aminopeptidase
MVVRKAETEHRFGGNDYLGFEHLTVVPFQRQMIETSMLSPRELEWVNAYHAECHRKLKPMLSGADLEWLDAACAPITA